MKSSEQRDDKSSISRPYRPHFFKIILQQKGKLEIPRKFVRKYGNGMSSPVLLELPNGAEWKVELAKSEGRLWLQNGWQKFAEHYSLNHGNFLVFRYDGGCHFSVLIFDQSASEVDYPHGTSAAKEGPKLKQQFRNPKIEEAGDGFSQPRKTRENSEVPCLRVRKRRENNAGYEQPQMKVRKTMKQLVADEKAKALQKASGFRSKKPFFKVVMQPSYVLSCYRSIIMAIPVVFARMYLTKRGHRNVNLQDSTGKTWTVSYHYLQNKGGNPCLHNGWKDFVRDKDLQVGDVCVFELINCAEISFKVTVYRG